MHHQRNSDRGTINTQGHWCLACLLEDFDTVGRRLADLKARVESASTSCRCRLAPVTVTIPGLVRAPKRYSGRRPRRRGGKASKRGLSREQMTVLMAMKRNSEPTGAVSSCSSTEALCRAPALMGLLDCEGDVPYPGRFQAFAVPRRERVNQSAGRRVRGVIIPRSSTPPGASSSSFCCCFVVSPRNVCSATCTSPSRSTAPGSPHREPADQLSLLNPACVSRTEPN